MPQTARGDVHRAFQAEPGDGEVEQRQGCDAVRMQPREAEGDHAADVVSDQAHRGADVELFEELAHVLGLVVLAVAAGGRLRGAEPAQVRGDDLPAPLGQSSHQPVPHGRGLRPSVQQHHGIPGPADGHVQARAVALDVALREAARQGAGRAHADGTGCFAAKAAMSVTCPTSARVAAMSAW